jgi:hypothetical protein
MDTKQLIRECIEAAGEFNSRRLWKRFSNCDCFGVLLPGQEELLLCSVMGEGGEEFGLMVVRGPQAIASFAALTAPEGSGDGAFEAIDMVGFTMGRFGDLDDSAQAVYRQAGLHPKFHDEVPDFLAKPANHRARLPKGEEWSLLRAVCRAAILADCRKLLEPAELDDPEGICILTVDGNPAEPEVSVCRESPPEPSVGSQSHRFAASGVDLSGLELLETTWLVATPPIPFSIEDDDRSMQMLLVLDESRGMGLQAKPFFAGDIGEAVRNLADAFHGRMPNAPKGLPSRMVFTNRRLFEALSPVLEARDVTCLYQPDVPELDDLMEDFLEYFEDTPLFEASPEEAPADETVPTDDDLAGWKTVDARLSDRFHAFLDDDRLWSTRAGKRYFGDEDLEYYFEEFGPQGVVIAYANWGVLSYRPTRNSKTQAEKMLAEGLPEAEARLLKSRMASHPSIYRVASCNPDAGTIDLDDVLLGGSVTVHDQLLSENIDVNLFLAARIYAAGGFRFFDLAGPVLAAGMGVDAVEFLRDCDVDFTPEGLRQQAGLFGRLWDRLEEWQSSQLPPRMCNMDGHDLIFHTASFVVNDPAAVRKALHLRKDVDFDEDNDEFVWTRATGPAAEKLGGPVTLGRIELIDSELILTTNSAQRYVEARGWLENLPGVRFENLTTRTAEEARNDLRPDEMMPEEPLEVTPEMTAELQAMLDRQYMNWIDMSLPILDGKSPRQACRTEAGRQQVITLIRTMPAPTGNAPLVVPREAMLRELGLESPERISPSAKSQPTAGLYVLEEPEPLASPSIRAEDKVGRNDPCPCGSGRKYKKCCGP